MTRSIALLVLGLAAIAPFPAEADAGAAFDYLYVASNEGDSSGGHVAIRTGQQVHHFQNKDGLLVLVRESSDEFVHTYALLSNRAIDVSRVGVSNEDFETIRSRLATRHRAQAAQLDVRTALRSDRDLLQQMLASPDGSLGPIDVTGLGYFAAHGSDAKPVPVLEALKTALVDAHGTTFVADKRRDTLRSLQTALERDPAAWPASPPGSVYEHPAFAEPWSRRVEAQASVLAALNVLEHGHALDRTAVLVPDGPAFALTPEEYAAIGQHREVLFSQLLRLFHSRRSDWGHAALVGMARLAAMDEALARHRIVVLDTLPKEADRIDQRRVARRAGILSEIRSETRRELDVARRFLVRPAVASGSSRRTPPELVWERFEERVNRHVELIRALRDGVDLRIAQGHLVPTRRAPIEIDGLRLPSREAIEADLSRVEERLRRHADRLDALHGYALISRNCVTALFETLNDAFADSPAGSAAALGGFVDGRRGFGFIPFVSAAQVDDRFHVVAREVIPSYRQMRLAELAHDGAGFLEILRESNTLTASTYRRTERDSFFVFFTDGALLPRPLLGAVNLASAIGETGWGVATLPFDRGHTLASGLGGAAVSLPELVFVNLRKGSNDWIAPGLRAWQPEPRQ